MFVLEFLFDTLLKWFGIVAGPLLIVIVRVFFSASKGRGARASFMCIHTVPIGLFLQSSHVVALLLRQVQNRQYSVMLRWQWCPGGFEA